MTQQPVPAASGRLSSTIGNAASLAWDSITAHKLRSFLTLLGVIIGVGSVILVGSAIEGLGAYAEASTAKAFGSESFIVSRLGIAKSRREVFDRLRLNKILQVEDERYLRQVNGSGSLYSPYRQRSEDIKREGLILEAASVLGTSATLAEIKELNIVEGRYFTDQEEMSRSAVAVIGDETKTTLFPDGGSPIGKTIKVNGIDFTIVGVQEKLGSAFGRSQDNSAYIPITVFNRLYGPGQDLAVYGRARPESHMALNQAVDLARVALRTKFHRKPGQQDRFEVVTPDAMRGFIDQLLGLITVVVIPVTCISLVVGGIVIMNIMLVSVTERTREIGIRKALGARRSDVMMQVLIESLFMSAMGGLLGVALGAVLTEIMARAFALNLRITLPYVLLSIFCSSAVGIASGWYPASRASKLDPITALRAE